MKAPNITPGKWTVGKRNSKILLNGNPVPYFTVEHQSESRVGFIALGTAPVTLITSDGPVQNTEGESNARFLAASKRVAEALNKMLVHFSVIDNLLHQFPDSPEADALEVALNSLEEAKQALLEAGYTE